MAVSLLPGFEWDAGDEKAFYDELWPLNSDGGPIEGGLIEASVRCEPPALLQLIESLTPDDTWLATEDDAMDVDGSEGKGGGDTQAQSGAKDKAIRFIDLTESRSALAINYLDIERDLHRDRGTFIVRDEYRLFMEHALSCLRAERRPGNEFFVRFFLTGQPGIGKSFGALYILMYLLASAQSVFFITSPNCAYFFSSHGVQRTRHELEKNPEIKTALKTSWVLIDLAGGDTNWIPPLVVRSAHCIVWTSSPQELAMKRFIKHFGAEPWFMKAWTNKEIAAATKRFEIPHKVIKDRLDRGGPVARCLFDAQPLPTQQSLENDIRAVLSCNTFGFTLDGSSDGKQPVHRVFLIQPAVVIDKASGRVSFQRTDYQVQYLSIAIAQRMFELAGNRLKRLQGQLAAALDISSSRDVAGRLVERMMHWSLASHTVRVPHVFGADYIAGTVRLFGKAANFSSESEQVDNRPLYLQPQSGSFAAVDAILVTEKKLGLLQTTLGESYPRNFGTMLRIMARLPKGVNVNVNGFEQVVYCLIGTQRERVKKVMAQAERTLKDLQQLDSHDLSKVLGITHTDVAHQQLSTFVVVGYTFHYQHGFTNI
ncbi:hypothetical protein BDZ89DRAFT_1158903 [Hymenopellis radicata]|nr:hypothetical protein BDZ89DRAFT_1158903 [Hymenopellis radicata]